MWSRHADGIDLLELNRRAQMRGSRMTHLFFFEIRALLRPHSTSRVHPFLLETAASIQNLNRNRRTRFCSFCLFGSFLPYCAELARGFVLVNRSQVPTQDYRGERQTLEDFFKIRSHATLAFERFDPAKRAQKLRVQLPEQFHLRRRKVALVRRAQNCYRANESLPFPEEEYDAMVAFLRRHVAAIKA